MALNFTRLGRLGLKALPSFRQTLPAISHQSLRTISSTNVNRHEFDKAMSHLGKCLVEYRCEVNRQLYQSTRKVSELSRQNQELTHKNQELTRQNNELIRRQNESTGPTLKSTDESIIRTKRLVTQTLEHYQLVYCYPTSGKKGTSGFSDILGDKDLEELVEKREEKKKQLLEILGEWVRVQKK